MTFDQQVNYISLLAEAHLQLAVCTLICCLYCLPLDAWQLQNGKWHQNPSKCRTTIGAQAIQLVQSTPDIWLGGNALLWGFLFFSLKKEKKIIYTKILVCLFFLLYCRRKKKGAFKDKQRKKALNLTLFKLTSGPLPPLPPLREEKNLQHLKVTPWVNI